MERSLAGVRTWSLVTEATAGGRPRAYVLVIGRGGCAAHQLPDVGELVIGRGDDADIVIDDRSASRRHARLIAAGGEVQVADLGSHNGTRINGHRIDGTQVVASGDQITIGDVTIVVHLRRRPVAGTDADDAGTRIVLGDREVIVADPAMAKIYELLARLGPADLPVLVCGETGVGKENAAYAVHHHSPRRSGPFVAINCAAIQETLVESELFGHEKGAFTGAAAAKPGVLEAAAGGTVFLDEVGELPAGVQAKLLRAVEAKRVTRVGSLKERELDIRIVAATNRDLEAEVEAGRFRRDLLFRLNVATVELPPLRERPREIGILARAFLAAACKRTNRTPLSLSAAARSALGAHDWPGNVRELRNVMELAAATVAGPAIELTDLRLGERGGRAAAVSPARTATPAQAPSMPTAALDDEDEVPAATAEFEPIDQELARLEARRMREALAASGGVHTRAAALIGMPLRTFTTKVKLYGLGGKKGP